MKAVVDGMSVVDPSLQTEVRGLTTSSDRPADILTAAALPGVLTALDVTVASQDAVAAGLDACASAYRRKVTRYSQIIPQLRRAGITFQPMVWSAEGRPHPATTRVLECTVQMVGRKLGQDSVAAFRRKWRHEIGIAIQRRKVAMIRACVPEVGGRRAWLAGHAPEVARTPPLEEVQLEGIVEAEPDDGGDAFESDVD